MRDLNQYSISDWVLARPAVAAFKEVRDAVIRDLYCLRQPRELKKFLAGHASVNGGMLAVVVAYEQPWLIRIFIDRFYRFVPGVRLLIADNSVTPARQDEIAAICRELGALYFRLPWNPVRNINRSHGNAVNWTYRNMIVPLRPRIFALFDHDIFATAPVDLEALLGDQPFYGHKIDRGYGWALWAGYSIFRFEAIAKTRPDFNPDMDRLLVTGGRNLPRLYRHYDPATLRFATHRREMAFDAQGRPLPSEVVDGWFHVTSSSYIQEKIEARDYYLGVLAASDRTSDRA
ncbi:MAG: hypothetical protein GEU91_14255 [Rhizobiales bacterium]|nr:hypothetical protein [Hyphomicrobiales bacterium]